MELTKEVLNKLEEDAFKMNDNINLGLLLDGKNGDLISRDELHIFQNEMNHDQRLAFIETVKKRKGLIK